MSINPSTPNPRDLNPKTPQQGPTDRLTLDDNIEEGTDEVRMMNQSNLNPNLNIVDDSQRSYESYEDAYRDFRRYEEDFEGYSRENQHRGEELWNEDRAKVRLKMQELKEKMADLKDKAPDAWGEMKEGIGQALSELGTSYRRAIRELK